MTREKEKKLAREQQLLEAARLGQTDQLEALLSQLVMLNKRKRTNPLASLRKQSGPQNVRDPVTGFTCLHHAALNGHWRCVQLLLAWPSVRPNALDYKGSSALHLAAWAGNLQIVRLLLDHQPATSQLELDFEGAAGEPVDVNLRNNDNQTPLSLAAQFGHDDVLVELLRRGADVHLRNNQLESPLDLACANGRLETARLLLSSRAQLVGELRRPHATALISVSSYALPKCASSARLDADECEQSSVSSQRRQISSSGGWSSLLRSHKQPDSPTRHQQQRRATLSASQFAIGDPQQQASSLLYAQTPTQMQRLSSANMNQLAGGERLLDHSPLHLAVRRGHTSLVNMLLSQFDANLLQLSSLGSVLHELAMSCMGGQSARQTQMQTPSAPYGELLNLFVAHLIKRTRGNFAETRRQWEALLSLPNGQGKTVFELLRDCEHRQLQQAPQNNGARDIQLFICDINKQLDKLVAPAPSTIDTASHLQSASVATRDDRRLFATSQQINSFVTMKRAPKRHNAQDQASTGKHVSNENRPPLAINAHPHGQPALIQTHWPLAQPVEGTQTIDRRILRHQFHNRPQGYVQHPFTNSLVNEPQVQPAAPSQLTRSVSNLISSQQPHSLPIEAHWAEQHAFDPAQQHLQNSQLLYSQQELVEARKGRSRSRDLGSLLMEVNQMRASEQQQHRQEQLYDNQPMPSRFNSQQQEARLAMGTVNNQLVRSQTDCSHLMSRFFGAPGAASASLQQQQQHQHQTGGHYQQRSENSSLASMHHSQQLAPTQLAQSHASQTLDRRAINRHYHVYEREFYPPRLVSSQQTQQQTVVYSSSQLEQETTKQKQAVAIVPPLKLDHHQQQQQQEQHPSRQQANNEERQQEQMDRFLCRRSRESNGNNAAGELTIDTAPSQSATDRRSMPASQSLESHLSGQSASGQLNDQSQIFESARQALMRDFDRMLGRELLGQQSAELQRSCDMASQIASSTSSHSILTGVSLDMDTRGERLIVSGTRITMPADSSTSHQLSSGAGNSSASLHQSVSSDSLRRVAGRSLEDEQVVAQQHQQQQQHQPDEQLSEQENQIHEENAEAKSNSSATQSRPPRPVAPACRTASITKVAPNSTARVAPQKPPRPSLKSQQIYKSLQVSRDVQPSSEHPQAQRSPREQPEAVIYDLPSTSSTLESGSANRPGSRASTGSSSLITTPRMQQPSSSTKKQTYRLQTALTEPPRERPPPPPSEVATSNSNQLCSPLSIIAPDIQSQADLQGPSSQDSVNSQVSAATTSDAHEHVHSNQTRANSLLKLGSINRSLSSTSSNSPSTSSSSVVSSSRSFVQQAPDSMGYRRDVNGHTALAQQHEVDSGVCTSNSPASLSHDSDGANQQAQLGGRTYRQTDSRAALQLNLTLKHPSSVGGSAIVSPPSPHTAQISIEEVLVPLDNHVTTQEVANQTSFIEYQSPDCDVEHRKRPESLSTQVEMVFGWLGSSNETAEQNQEPNSMNTLDERRRLKRLEDRGADYENCLDLQDKLQTARCRSLGNLFHEISRVHGTANKTDPGTKVTSSSRASSQVGSSEGDADYAEITDANDSRSSESNSSDRLASRSDLQTTSPSSRHDESAPTSRKEITLKVVIDETQRSSSSGNDLFYIDPSELKKITTLNGKTDASTLTDEELCASVDKESGYIRFTLKKRRNSSLETMENTPERSQLIDSTNLTAEYPQLNEEKQVSSAKRTKMNDESNEKSEKCAPSQSEDSNESEGKNEKVNEEHQEAPLSDSPEKVVQSIQQPSTTTPNGPKIAARKASADSIQMDTSQASSSSSEMSIKSIVALKNPHQDSAEQQDKTPTASPTGKSTEIELDLKPIESETAEGHDKTDARLNDALAFATSPARLAAKSIVTETARRLEAAAAAAAAADARNVGLMRRPVAATRRSLQSVKVAQPVALNSNNKQPEEAGKENPIVPLVSVKKSICWPPKQANNGDSGMSEGQHVIAPTIGRVTANRLSFQKLIEETNNKNSMQTNRPKPPPPAKPAGLVLSRFKTQT